MTASELIIRLGGITRVSEFLDVPIGTVSAWGTRGLIPSEYWQNLMEMARAKRLSGVTLASLFAMQQDVLRARAKVAGRPRRVHTSASTRA